MLSLYKRVSLPLKTHALEKNLGAKSGVSNGSEICVHICICEERERETEGAERERDNRKVVK